MFLMIPIWNLILVLPMQSCFLNFTSQESGPRPYYLRIILLFRPPVDHCSGALAPYGLAVIERFHL